MFILHVQYIRITPEVNEQLKVLVPQFFSNVFNVTAVCFCVLQGTLTIDDDGVLDVNADNTQLYKFPKIIIDVVLRFSIPRFNIDGDGNIDGSENTPNDKKVLIECHFLAIFIPKAVGNRGARSGNGGKFLFL